MKYVALNSLPENGVPPDLMTVETDDDIVAVDNCSPDVGPPTDNPSEDIVYDDSTGMSIFLPVGLQQQHDIEALKSQVSESEPMLWPSVDNEPLNEYQVSHLATMAFPTFFPVGKGDPTNQGRLRDVPLHERIKHLLKFAEIIDGKWVYRFANHPRFSYWAFNMIQRKQILQQSGIFLKQNPDMHWPELHALFKAPTDCEIGNSTSELRRQNVINNPHIVDWFFTQRLESLVKHWLYDTLGAKWHWFRYEYQGRGSIHCHGTAKLKNDPGKRPLDTNEQQSRTRLQNVDRKLDKTPELKREYNNIISEQLSQGGVEVAPDTSTGDRVYYMPHKPVVRQNATTTKVRMVFDASAKPNASADSIDKICS
ncbi:Hypothetical predicted protein [Paramuricea clavata]|uniref:Helitron helicase-like domain-containing protein n=1 Tax=Paramuricea clavata TaxID=317549 RepID=A0A6S7I2I8_PARCT|nr:Hypothetical predicted protein [Paramuricea clavata]